MAASDDFYNELIPEINEVLDELGTTYQVRGKSAFDSDTLTTIPGASRTVVGLVADQATTSSIGGFVPESALAWIGKKNLLLKASAAPQPGEEILVEGNWFPLAKISPIKPADVVVLYILDVTR